MSADILPCGCEGHFDNEELCRYPALLEVAEAMAQALEATRERLHAGQFSYAGYPDAADALASYRALVPKPEGT